MYRQGDTVLIDGVLWKVVSVNTGKNRLSIRPVLATAPKSEQDEVDEEWINEDPVWPIFSIADQPWETTAKPQQVIAKYGEEWFGVASEETLYPPQFFTKDTMFRTREEALSECERRNTTAKDSAA